MTPPDWTGALCAGVPNFHDPSPEGIEDALSICDGCPLRARCHTWARTEYEYDGVAGGVFWSNGKPRKPPTPVRFLSEAQQILAAHAAYVAGDRDQWAVEGHREYDRARKRRSRRAAA